MKSYPYVPTMVQAITVLTVLKMMTRAQTSCGSGNVNGKVMFERLPNTQLQGFDDDIVRDTAPPFMVLEKCQDMCLRDRTTNNIVRMCASFDFQPGSRIATFNGGPEYEESTCYLTREQAMPEGLGSYILVPNSVHFTEVCISSSRPERECPNRRYIFERHPRKKLKLPAADIKEVPATNRSECEDKCLNEFSFVCRSASFDSGMRMCTLSRFTRRTHPELLEDNANSDYLENTCLNAERRCDGLAVFIKEENKRLGGPFEVDLFSNITLEDCQSMCVRAEKYFCRSIEYDEMTKQCTLSEEDSISQKDDIGVSSSPTHHFYDFACLDSPRGSEYPDNSVTSHLFTGKKPDTAFQRYRNSRLGGEHHSEISGRSLSECLDECLRQPSFQCRSAVYSDRYRTCRLSRYNQRDGMRIIYDADYDYYENLMLGSEGEGTGTNGRPDGNRPDHGDRNRPGGRPGQSGGDRYYPKFPYDRPYDRPPFGGEDNYYPGDDRYGPGPGRPPGGHPIGPDRYPDDRDRYPGDRDRDRYPGDRDRDRYPGGDRDRDRYPGDRDRDRYPGDRDRDRDRYSGDRDRFPGGYPGDERDQYQPGVLDMYLPSGGDRYSPDDRYGGVNRFRPGGYGGGDYDRYAGGDRYANRFGDRDRFGPGERYGGDRPLIIGGDRDRYNGYNKYGNGVDRYRPGVGVGLGYDDKTTGYRPVGYDDNKVGYRPAYRPPYDDRNKPVSYRPGYDDKPLYRPPGGGYGDRDKPSYFRPGYDDRDKPGYSNRPGLGGVTDPYGGGNRYGGSRFSNSHSYYGDDRDGGSRWFFRPDRRPFRPPNEDFDRPPFLAGGATPPHRRPISPGPDGPIYDGIGGAGPGRPYSIRCDEGENFKQVGSRQRIRKDYVRRFLQSTSLSECQRECVETRDFVCRSFNFREGAAPYDNERENCELSDRDSRDLEIANPQYFENTGNFDYYERSNSRQGADGECLDVTQVCNEDGMEFTLRTPEGFYGRIYTYGFYDRCFFRGNGGTLNVLRISGAQGYPECGTQRYGDTMTNIVVVQFSDFVQTGKDKRFNLTCLFRGPGEAVVSSGFIGAGDDSRSGSPVPIEYLPAENTLSSKVRLMILYQGRPTTTIAVGDPLTFRLEAQDGYNYVTDIFATNVVARDPYSGRSVQLIDRFGCPVDSFVFPELDRGRSGDSLEARFNAFKIPESNFLVFEATVRTCRDGCQPAYCQSGTGRSEPSFGRRKRSINDTELVEGSNNTLVIASEIDNANETTVSFPEVQLNIEDQEEKEPESPEYVREMIEVFESREELQQEARRAVPVPETVCITSGEYQGLITAILALAAILITVALIVGLAYRRYWAVMHKNRLADRSAPSSRMSTASPYPTTRSSGISALSGMSLFGHNNSNGHSSKPFTGFGTIRNFPGLSGIGNNNSRHDDLECSLPVGGGGLFEDPSEPIYTDPSLFERSRSLRSIAVSQKQKTKRSNDQ